MPVETAENVRISHLRRMARVLAVLTSLLGIGGGAFVLLYATFVCFDTCPPQSTYVASLMPVPVQGMVPALLLGFFSFVAYVDYARAVGQRHPVLVPALVLSVGILVYVGLLVFGKGQIAVAGDLSYEPTLERWILWWGAALALISAGWTVFVFARTYDHAKASAPAAS